MYSVLYIDVSCNQYNLMSSSSRTLKIWGDDALNEWMNEWTNGILNLVIEMYHNMYMMLLCAIQGCTLTYIHNNETMRVSAWLTI
jgi:hypothetical protein